MAERDGLESRMVLPTTANKLTDLLPTATFPHLELDKLLPILSTHKAYSWLDHSVTYCS
jgi:hypothetical protein